jgi:hypothetical protein
MEEAVVEEKRVRGAGRGSRFSVLERGIWDRLWDIETDNRLNLVTAFLVLLAGTGADHRLTRWSARACEEHAGMGKPRAKRAIDELIRAGLVELLDTSTPMAPHYRLPAVDRAADPIFLPVQLVTGFGSETPLLRRVRETGDTLLLRMLIDFYGAVQLDATYGLPLAMLKQRNSEPETEARKVTEVGVNAVWALSHPNQREASAACGARHYVKKSGAKPDWQPFWDRVANLVRVGGLWFEPWVMDGEADDAEPLFPVDLAASYGRAGDEVSRLTLAVTDAAEALIGERNWILDRHADQLLVTLPVHHRPPCIRGIARLKVEPDSPGHRVAYAKRMTAIEDQTARYQALTGDAHAGRYNMPLGRSQENR